MNPFMCLPRYSHVSISWYQMLGRNFSSPLYSLYLVKTLVEKNPKAEGRWSLSDVLSRFFTLYRQDFVNMNLLFAVIWIPVSTI